MSLTSTPLDALAIQVGWTLVHFIWQAAAVALVLRFCLNRMGNRSPEARYVVAVIALGLVAVAPFSTYAVNDNLRTGGALLYRGQANAMRDGPVELPTHYIARALAWVDATVGPFVLPLAGIWTGMMLLFLVWRVIGWWTLGSRFAPSTLDASLLEEFRSVALKMRLRRVAFARTERIDSPATFGWWRPMVILPEAVIATLPPDQLLALVAHELAHIRRRDYLVNLLQVMTRSVYFFHPAVGWICRVITAERESCCDDAAVQIVGKTVYRRALAAAEEMRHSASLALHANDASVVDRVQRLTTKTAPRRTGWVPYVVSPLIIAIILMILTQVSRSDEVWWAIEQRRSTEAALYDALGIAGHSQAFLAPLAVALTTPRPTDAQLLAIANTITAGAAGDELAQQARRFDAEYKHHPDWRFQQAGQRMTVVYRMASRAKALASSDPAASRLLARGAIALSIQELPLTKIPFCGKLLEDASLVTAARLSGHEGERLRLAMLEYQRKVNVANDAKYRGSADDAPEQPAATQPSVTGSVMSGH